MVKKSEKYDNLEDFNDISSEEDVVEAIKEIVDEAKPKSWKEPAPTLVKLIRTEPVKIDGVDYFPVRTVEGELKGYLVKTSKVVYTRQPQNIVLSDEEIELFTWDDVLNYLFTDIETVRKNVLLSFWQAGALFENDISKPDVRRQVFNTAFPYKLP